jgi:uridylate kinase
VLLLLLLLLQVWKDVDGVLSSDPRIVSDAQPVNELTYEEATELAFFGAQVCQNFTSLQCRAFHIRWTGGMHARGRTCKMMSGAVCACVCLWSTGGRT